MNDELLTATDKHDKNNGDRRKKDEGLVLQQTL
jgi:hypothetical protein